MTKSQLMHDALALSHEERADLALRLLESLDGDQARLEHAAIWEGELIRRLESLESGQELALPARKTIAELRRRRNGKD